MKKLQFREKKERMDRSIEVQSPVRDLVKREKVSNQLGSIGNFIKKKIEKN